jgi:ATP-dependent DNA helicase RecQ
VIRERDEERLKQMTYYCFTKDCLREYILRYFGQYGMNFCDNCSNCLTSFEEVDVTEISQDIIGCIRECNQKYGINVIITTLIGRNNAKLATIHMNNSSYFGKRSAEGESRLKHVMNKLLIDDYLYLTNDKYSIVKINKSAKQIEEGMERVIMKLSAESSVEPQLSNTKKKRKSEVLNSKGLDLFEVLRQVRTRLAKEEGMPPYIIFSDKTLTDMCVKVPHDQREMMKVSGVGENKFVKYGKQFLDAIHEFTGGRKEALSYGELPVEEASPRNISLKKTKTEFYLTEEMKDKIVFEETVTISQFVEQMNALRDEQQMKRLASVHVTAQLREQGYLMEKYHPGFGRNVTTVTEDGYVVGISTEKRMSEKGNEYEIVMYNEEAQKMLVSVIQKLRK